MLRRSNEVHDCEEDTGCFLRRRDCGGCSIYIEKLEDEEESENDSEEDEEVEDEDDNNEEDQREQE